jgi:uncharacterized protein YllA (UPF0747 family)
MYLAVRGNEEADLSEQFAEIDKTFEEVAGKAAAVDKSLEGFIYAQKQKIVKEIENISKRIKKAEENKFATGLNQLEKVKDKLFPGGGLQERHENIFTFLANDPDFIDQIKDLSDPFDFRFNIVQL